MARTVGEIPRLVGIGMQVVQLFFRAFTPSLIDEAGVLRILLNLSEPVLRRTAVEVAVRRELGRPGGLRGCVFLGCRPADQPPGAGSST